MTSVKCSFVAGSLDMMMKCRASWASLTERGEVIAVNSFWRGWEWASWEVGEIQGRSAKMIE